MKPPTKKWLREMNFRRVSRAVLFELARGSTPEQIHAEVDMMIGRYANEPDLQAAARAELSELLRFEGTLS